MSVAREMFNQKAIGSTSDVRTCKRVGRFVCPRLERESLLQTNIRSISHWVSTQAGQYACDRQTQPDETRQCRVSRYYLTKDDWGTMATVKPLDARSECEEYSYSTLKSKECMHSKPAYAKFAVIQHLGNRSWRWCCGFDNGEWQKISASTMVHTHVLTFRLLSKGR